VAARLGRRRISRVRVVLLIACDDCVRRRDDVSAGRQVGCHDDRCPSIDGCHGNDNLASLRSVGRLLHAARAGRTANKRRDATRRLSARSVHACFVCRIYDRIYDVHRCVLTSSSSSSSGVTDGGRGAPNTLVTSLSRRTLRIQWLSDGEWMLFVVNNHGQQLTPPDATQLSRSSWVESGGVNWLKVTITRRRI